MNFKTLFTVFLWLVLTLPSLSWGGIEITGSSLDNAEKVFVLKTPDNVDKLKIDKKFLTNPKRVFFDIENASLKDIKAKTDLKTSGINNIKIAQFSTKPNIVRVVFTGTEESLDAIRATTLKNLIIFNIDDITTKTPRSFVYKDNEPDLSEADYFCYYEKLNVKLSNNINKGKKTKTQDNSEAQKSSEEKLKTPKNDKWNEIKTISFPAKYTINSITKEEDGIKVMGIGKLEIKSPFYLDNPERLVVDIPNSKLKKKDFLNTLELNQNEKIRFGQFNEKTVRMVIESPTPKEFDIIISPNMNTLFVKKSKNLKETNIPFLKKAFLSKFEASQVDKQTTKLVVRSSESIVHSIKKVEDGAVIGFLNMQSDETFLEEVIPTKQFKTLHVVPAENDMEGTLWKIPLKASSRITTELSADAKELVILIKDKIFPSKDIVIKSGSTVLIDPGHGGKDAGAVRCGLYEKELVLDLSKKLRTYLKSHGVKVFMTRYSDKTLSLKSRVYKANKIRPDVFVSIHINSSRKPQISGVETHWYRYRSKKLAQIIQNNMSLGINTTDRGMFRSRFYVINHTRVPAVLVETGFLSNTKERCSLLNSNRQKNTVKAIGNGILLYLAMQYENK